MNSTMRQILIHTSEILALIAVPVCLFVCAFSSIDQTALISLGVTVLAIVPFFLRFEQSKPRPRDFMPIVVLSALAAAGRIIFGPVPNVMPVTAIVIVAGAALGRDAGFLTGALAALSSNMFFGQGPWTPWQMYAWGVIGFLAGVFFARKARKTPLWIIVTYGFIASLAYGFLLDSWHIVGFISPLTWPKTLATYGAGLVFNVAHAVSTAFFLIVIYRPWVKKIERIKQKFGIIISLQK